MKLIRLKTVPPEVTRFAVDFKDDLIKRGLFFIGQTETREMILDGRRYHAVVARHTNLNPAGHPGVEVFERVDEPELVPEGLTMSFEGLEFLAHWEGEVLYVYRDSVGIPTIGIGHVIRPGESFTTITHEQALELLRHDVAVAEHAVAHLGVELTQPEFDALVSFAFNVGTGALIASTLAKKLRAGDKPGAAEEFLRWDKAAGKPLVGLHNRRLAERELFLTVLPESDTERPTCE